jgi:hypothetical protein
MAHAAERLTERHPAILRGDDDWALLDGGFDADPLESLDDSANQFAAAA